MGNPTDDHDDVSETNSQARARILAAQLSGDRYGDLGIADAIGTMAAYETGVHAASTARRYRAAIVIIVAAALAAWIIGGLALAGVIA